MNKMFLIIEPNCDRNDSDKYRLVDSVNYLRYHNGAITSYAFTAHDTYEAALEAGNRASE